MKDAKPYDRDEVRKLALRLRSQPSSSTVPLLFSMNNGKKIAEIDGLRLAATLDQLQRDNARLRLKVNNQAASLMQLQRAHRALKNDLRKLAQGDAKIQIILPPDTRPLEAVAE